MSNSLLRKELVVIAIYKSIEDSFRYALALLLIIFNFNFKDLAFNIFKKKLTEYSSGFFFNLVSNHTREPPIYLAKILVVSLIIFSLLEIFFLIGILTRKRWGAIGFFCIQFLWVPIDLLIISKFLLFSKITTIVLEIVIIWFMIRLLTSKKDYFKK